jgi:phosphoribosylamine--glycine ligase
MKVLVIGGGGREHALCWKLAQSPRLEKLYCAPGNAGIAQVAECLPFVAEDFNTLSDFAKTESIGLTVVGPETPLVAGITDHFRERGLAVFGPTKAAAQIEGSKAFAKTFMSKYGIPTAAFGTYKTYREAVAALADCTFPVVIKASGLAAGKGVIICPDRLQANEAVKNILLDRRFGEAGSAVVIEEFLEGEEASILVLTDGEGYFCLPASQDHKRLLDGDQGPNTGGMGAYAPAPVINSFLQTTIEEEILKPTLAGLRAEGCTFTGCLYIGVMLTKSGLKVLEYNCRFGDPETQAVLPLFEGDLLDAFMATVEGRVADIKASIHPGAAACVVIASGGYPSLFQKGKPISGLDEIPDGVTVFHAGSRRDDGHIVTDGGRVLGVTARADNLQSAVDLAYRGVNAIRFEGMSYRRDIARRALK